MADDDVPEIEVTGVESVRLEDGGEITVITFATAAGGFETWRMPREAADQFLAQLESASLPNEAAPIMGELRDLLQGLSMDEKKGKTTH